MIIEIRKAGFTNKGAEMMLLSALDEIKSRYPESTVVMAPSTEIGSQPFSKLTALGMRTKFKLRRGSIDLSFVGNFIPRKIREAYGIVLNKEVDVVLDASGFSYSDQWGEYDCMELKHAVSVGKKTQQKFILLPQAFGPFNNNKNKSNMQEVIENADLIFARDEVSFNFLEEFDTKKNNIVQKPDFTCLLSPLITETVDKKKNKVPVIPNYRMLDKTDKNMSSNYMAIMIELIKQSIDFGFEPYFLIHETDLDRDIAEKINSKLDSPLDILEEDNPRVIKGFLGVANFAISSRYHASISGLSQGTPVIGTSWSHKYEELFAEYDFKEALYNMNDSDTLQDLFISLSSEIEYKNIKNKLIKKSAHVKSETREMWENVFSIVEGK